MEEMTAQQGRLLTRLAELEDADDWLGVVALEKEALALAQELRGAHPGWAGKIFNALGLGFRNVGEYGRARELHEQRKAMAEALGDRAGVAAACGNLGNCYFSAGDYGRARELHEQGRAICEALGDRAGVATACGNLTPRQGRGDGAGLGAKPAAPRLRGRAPRGPGLAGRSRTPRTRAGRSSRSSRS